MRRNIIIFLSILLVVGLLIIIGCTNQKTENSNFPRQIGDCEQTDIACYQDLASNGYKDIKLCENHPAKEYNTSIASNYVNRCYGWIARNTQNPTICQNIKSDDKIDDYDFSAYIKQYCIAVSSQSVTQCIFEGKDAEYWKYHCISDIAQLKENVELCKQLDEYHLVECYVDVAYSQDNIKICNNLENKGKSRCQTEFKNLKSNNIPNWVENIKK